jgi:hypothetical protein
MLAAAHGEDPDMLAHGATGEVAELVRHGMLEVAR